MSSTDPAGRVNVSWRASMTLADGRVVPARLREISDSNLVMTVEDCPPPVHEPLQLTLHMPDVERPERLYMVPTVVLPVFVVLQGYDYRADLQWQELPENARQMIQAWMRRLKGR